MKLPNNLGLKAYTVIFGIFALGGLISLMTSDGESSIFYNILLQFYDLAILWYILALLDAILSCLTLIPLFLRAFERPPVWINLFRLFFIVRLITLILGHNYEWVVLKSAFIGTPRIGWLTLGVWGLFIFPSFKEHYIYAFQSKK